eukprot:jgi/Tetstr1/431107/TSEL_020823.t1
MGWSVSPYCFCSLTAAFNRHMRRPDFTVTSQGVRRAKLSMGRRQALRSHFRGCRMLPYMDNFVLFASNRAHAYNVRDHLTLCSDVRSKFVFRAIKPARFYLRELHDVLRTKDSWSGRVKMTRQLRRELEWWATVPNHSNGRSIYKSVETAYVHVDSSGHGWGAVLNETTKARGFRYDGECELHITYKELKAVRYSVLAFL